MISGGCLCGAVRYEAEGEPLFSLLCHCRHCQRASGTGHVPVMGMPRARFTVSGVTRSYSLVGGSGLQAIRHFCPTCGSLLFGTAEVAPEMVTICAGSLDDPSVFKPELALFTSRRQAWDVIAGSIAEFETVPPG